MKSIVFFVVALYLGKSYAEVSCEDIKIIVDAHNDVRLKIARGELEGQPKASNMQKIAWDDKLAELAQNYAEKNEFEHNPNPTDERFSVGENIFESIGTYEDLSPKWNMPVEGWFNERKWYTYATIPEEAYEKFGHYTQVIWADTLYVGCGYSTYEKNDETHKLYVCNYGPSGNKVEYYPYTTGDGCEDLCREDQNETLYGEKCSLETEE